MGPDTKDHSMLGSIFGPLFFGSSHLENLHRQQLTQPNTSECMIDPESLNQDAWSLRPLPSMNLQTVLRMDSPGSMKKASQSIQSTQS